MVHIEERIPLKQGLKLVFCLILPILLYKIEERIPLKQGLKLKRNNCCSLVGLIEERIPLKQGLKRPTNLWDVILA